MEKERLQSVTDIYCHASCPDGLASAMICVSAYAVVGLRPKIWFIQYGTEKMAKMEARPNQLFVDITPPFTLDKESGVPTGRWEEWKKFSPVVLDHHETARGVTDGLGGVYGSSSQSGASLAFEHVMKPLTEGTDHDLEPWAKLAEFAAVRDTWQDSSPNWAMATGQAHALSSNNPYELIDQARDGSLDWGKLRAAAEKAWEKTDFRSRKLSEGAHFDTAQVDGVSYLIGAFNCTEKMDFSDTCNTLLKHGCDVAVAYFMLSEDGGPKVSVSIRTNGEISARAISEHYDGGGHHRASGFRIKDGLNASLRSIVHTVQIAMLECRKKQGAIQKDDGRERKTAEQVLDSLRAIRAARRRPA
jgi:oligoribonuclease NrnB/cAMP/cGMP phosphodiesterase (DHH superfamily)